MYRSVISFLILGLTWPVLARAALPPLPHDGPTLDITFTGVLVFVKQNGNAYRVVFPRAKDHVPYLRFRADGYDPSQTDYKPVGDPFMCPKTGGPEFVAALLLGEDVLKIEPDSAVDQDNSLDTRGLRQLISLKKIAPKGNFDNDYNTDHPVAGKVAAQFDIQRGLLVGSALEGPFVWRFKTADAVKDSGRQVCGVAAMSLRLKILKGTKRIGLVSSRGQRLTLLLDDGATTEVFVGNSLKEDMYCPQKPLEAIDKHFANLYSVFHDYSEPIYVPHYGAARCKAPEDDRVVVRSLGGSNCMGAQWP